jgi:hypothetical protein
MCVTSDSTAAPAASNLGLPALLVERRLGMSTDGLLEISCSTILCVTVQESLSTGESLSPWPFTMSSSPAEG